MMTESAPASPQTPLEYALAYARMGWPVIPINYVKNGKCSCGDSHDGEHLSAGSVGKHPYKQYAPNGVYSATTDENRIRAWWTATPDLNIGIATGGTNRHVVDVDNRNGGHILFEALCEQHGYTPNTLTATTGGGGKHYVYSAPDGFKLKYLGRGIDIKGDGGLIAVEPSVHLSGRQYIWEDGSPFDWTPIEEAPAWMLEPKIERLSGVTTVAGGAIGFIPDGQMADLRDALRYISAEEREVWRDVGAAIHSTSDPRAYDVWNEWSKTCPEKYQEPAQRKLWAWWENNRGSARYLHIELVFYWARENGWTGRPPDPVPVETVRIMRPKASDPADDVIVSMPGVLGEFARWIVDSSERPQPQLAIATAVALGGVVGARKYRSTRRNFTSNYVLLVGRSGCGKEYARTAICAALDAADWGSRIGPPSYASDSAVISALLSQPAHISICDEMGALLGNMKSDAAHHARSAQRQLIELFGSLDGSARPKQFSTLTLRPDQADAMKNRIVKHPALSLLGLSTPRTFYSSLGEESIEGGFLGRFVVVTTDIGMTLGRPPSDQPVPSAVVDWIKAVRHSGAGNLSHIEAMAGDVPHLIRVPICPGAQKLFDEYAARCITSADKLEEEGMSELEVRSVEKAMRIALILAVARDPVAPVVIDEDADWSCRWVAHWTARTVCDVRTHMHGSDFAKYQAELIRLLVKAGERGQTDAELPKLSRTWAGLDLRLRKSVQDALQSGGRIRLVEMSTGGRSRKAWVAVDDEG